MTGRLRAIVAHAEKPTRQRLRERLDCQSSVETVAECCDVEAVLNVLAEAPGLGSPCDVLFLDPALPGANRVDVLTVVVRSRPGRVPAVVIVTADDAEAMRARTAGAAAYLLKPFSDEQFEKVLRLAIGATGRSIPG